MGLRGHGHAKPGVLEGEAALSDAVSNDEQGKALRERFFMVLRAPNYSGIHPLTGELTHPDEMLAKAQATALFMPPLSGDRGDRTPGEASTWLSPYPFCSICAWRNGLPETSPPAM